MPCDADINGITSSKKKAAWVCYLRLKTL